MQGFDLTPGFEYILDNVAQPGGEKEQCLGKIQKFFSLIILEASYYSVKLVCKYQMYYLILF